MAWKIEMRPNWYCIYDEIGWYVAGCQSERQAQLIANAPQMLEALREIAEGAIVSPDQSPGEIAEQVLRVLRLIREDNVKSLEFIGMQQRRAERAEEALEAIRDKAERMSRFDHTPAAWEMVRGTACAAIAAVKGEKGNDL